MPDMYSLIFKIQVPCNLIFQGGCFSYLEHLVNTAYTSIINCYILYVKRFHTIYCNNCLNTVASA